MYFGDIFGKVWGTCSGGGVERFIDGFRECVWRLKNI